jgi:hypothetical protein
MRNLRSDVADIDIIGASVVDLVCAQARGIKDNITRWDVDHDGFTIDVVTKADLEVK